MRAKLRAWSAYTPMPHRVPPVRTQLLLFVVGYLLIGSAALFGVITQAQVQARPADPPLSQEDQAILAQVAELIGEDTPLQVEQSPDGTHFVDFDGTRRAVLLVKLAVDGTPVLRCVTTLEEARAFLAGNDPVTAGQLAGRAVVAERRPPEVRNTVAAASEIVITNLDPPGQGFNDTTPVTPVGGNTGTTVGEQRLIAFEYAARIWAEELQTTVPIQIAAQFAPLECNASGGVLGSAGPVGQFFNFTGTGNAPGALRPNTWYPAALADKLAGRDLDPTSYDLVASFNGNLGSPGCLENRFWYYGLDGQFGPGGIDLVTVLLHEFGHGLGFLSFVSTAANTRGQNFPYNSFSYPNESPGAINDVWNFLLFDRTLSTYWNELTPLQRSFSMTNTGQLVWTGEKVRAAAPEVLRSEAVFTVTMPSFLSGSYPISEASFGPAVPVSAIAAPISVGVDPSDAAGPAPSDGCSTLTNSAEVSGTIVLLDRGTCDFTIKARNAQAAGAAGVLIANNVNDGSEPVIVGSDPTITIPVVGIAQSLGADLRAAITTTGATGAFGRNLGTLVGADIQGRVRLYAVDPVLRGSSVSHFDNVATPNLLMEPAINPDIDQSLDLTDELMEDIGWFPDINFNAVDDNNELRLSVTQTITPTGVVQSGDVITLTISVQNGGLIGSSNVRLSNMFPAELSAISWNAAYASGATGPISGTGNIDAVLSLPADSSAEFTVTAQVQVNGIAEIINTARIEESGPELDFDTRDNTATVIVLTSSNRYLLPMLFVGVE